MALIKCPECNHDVSEFAATCPNCGYGITPKLPVSRIRSNTIPVVIICIFSVVILFSLYLYDTTLSRFTDIQFATMEEFLYGSYQQEMLELRVKRYISIISLVVSSISICVCTIIIIINNKKNKMIIKGL